MARPLWVARRSRGYATPFTSTRTRSVASSFTVISARRAGTIALDGNAVSRDPAVVADYLADPLVYRGKVPARTAHEIYRAIASYPARVGALAVPCLLMHGDADTLVSAVDAAPLFQRIASADKTIRIWPGLFHEIFNEPEREEVLALTAEWLQAHPAR